MKYIKQYEKKSDIDFDKIYSYCTKVGLVKFAGKFSLPYAKSGEAGSLFNGVVIETYFYYSWHILEEGDTQNIYINGNDWKNIKEATKEEKEKYEFLTNIKRYNL